MKRSAHRGPLPGAARPNRARYATDCAPIPPQAAEWLNSPATASAASHPPFSPTPAAVFARAQPPPRTPAPAARDAWTTAPAAALHDVPAAIPVSLWPNWVRYELPGVAQFPPPIPPTARPASDRIAVGPGARRTPPELFAAARKQLRSGPAAASNTAPATCCKNANARPGMLCASTRPLVLS